MAHYEICRNDYTPHKGWRTTVIDTLETSDPYCADNIAAAMHARASTMCGSAAGRYFAREVQA